MFLEIRDIKKSFGTGDSKVDVLKGLDLDTEYYRWNRERRWWKYFYRRRKAG